MTTTRRADLRTLLTASDPGLTRLRSAGTALAAIAAAVGLAAAARALAPAAPGSMLLIAGIVGMFSTMMVSGTGRDRRITSVLMILPAAGGLAVGTLLAPYRYGAIAGVVVVSVAAVWVRRWGPRWFSLGMIAFFTVFITQILRSTVGALPWLVLGAVLGVMGAFLVREVLFRERPERTLLALLAALRARAHALVVAADHVAAGAAAPGPARPEAALAALQRAQERLTETAISVSDLLEAPGAAVSAPVDLETLSMRVVDTELVMEALVVAVARLAGADDPGTMPPPPGLAALRAGLAGLASALLDRAEHTDRRAAARDAQGAVAGLLADPGTDDRVHRVALAIRAVADAIQGLEGPAHGDTQWGARPETGKAVRPVTGETEPGADDDGLDEAPAADGHPGGGGSGAVLSPTTRQAIQVGLSLVLTVAVSELIAPSRWYWAVITAFIVFTGAQTRGDLLARSWLRVLGTLGGVVAGIAVATVVAGHPVVSVVLLAVFLFLGLYLARVSPALMPFFITAVLALVYGLLGQFSPQLLVVRLEETAIGATISVAVAFVVLPQRTRSAFVDALTAAVQAMVDVLDAACDRLVGVTPERSARAASRVMHAQLVTVRERAEALTAPGLRARRGSSQQRVQRVASVCDHYLRTLARASETEPDPRWASTLRPAVSRVGADLDRLVAIVADGLPPRRGSGAEELLDAAERACRSAGPELGRDARLTVVDRLRRVDAAVGALVRDLPGPHTRDDEADDEPATESLDPGTTRSRPVPG